MKCPKCSYLGFETGDRCRNCGYDFSLMSGAPGAAAELPLRPSVADDAGSALADFDLQLTSPPVTPLADVVTGPATSDDVAVAPAEEPAEEEPEEDEPVIYIERGPAFRPEGGTRPAVEVKRPPAEDSALPAEPEEETVQKPMPARPVPPLPLFTRPGQDDDAPLIKLPAAPRAPLAVRRTPVSPRLRAVSRPAPRREPLRPEPQLSFSGADVDERVPEVLSGQRRPGDRGASHVWRDRLSDTDASLASGVRPSGPVRRVVAVVLDHAILTFIDFAVVYFTLRILSLDLASWDRLPPVPLAAFLILIKLAYFSAFTAIGGQTIGKMAAHIRVVADDYGTVDGPQAVSRTLFGALSTLAFGLGFLPGLFGDGRSLHDRAARTRVVGLEPA